MKIIKIDKCSTCPLYTLTTYPVEPICNHNHRKDENGNVHLKEHTEDKYWKIEDVNVVQDWCVLEDAK